MSAALPFDASTWSFPRVLTPAITNNVEIDGIWGKWQAELESLREVCFGTASLRIRAPID